MILKTVNYDMFVFRSDNRQKGVDDNHVQCLIDSIKSNNMLELRPIQVNSKMEIIDGQHRVKAAKALGLEIFYTVTPDANPLDIISLNIQKPWQFGDFLNFYIENDYPEYKKLQQFMLKNRLELRLALRLTSKSYKQIGHLFKTGKYVFCEDPNHGIILEICHGTIDYIQRMNPNSTYVHTSRFWSAMIKLVQHVDFNVQKWMSNITKMTERFCIKATQDDYLKLFMEVHNWHNQKRISLLEADL